MHVRFAKRVEYADEKNEKAPYPAINPDIEVSHSKNIHSIVASIPCIY
jgi:hypothetical protein